MPRPTPSVRAAGSLCALAVFVACSGNGSDNSTTGDGGDDGGGTSTSSSSGGSGGASSSGDATAGNDSGGQTGSSSGSDGGGPESGSSSSGGSSDARADAGLPSGWLYTSGNKVYVSNGSGGGSVWVGRGVNLDDIFLCGYNNTLGTASPDTLLESEISTLYSTWDATFFRISLGMDSYTEVSWLSDASQYKTPMVNVIDAVGSHAGARVLVTLRSDGSMIGQDTSDGDAEATGLPSDSVTTPNATTYPTGTDATYVALVDTFANDSFVLFGLTNEPGGNKLSNSTISAAMSHAVGTIRAEEDKLGVPHHIVSVQGNGWTSDISFYATTPLPYDNVVYEVHGYPPSTASYTYSNVPVILGEYGSLATGTSAAFYTDIENKQIPNLAWDFEPYSDCAPDLVNVTDSTTNITLTGWGSTVQAYLQSP